MDLRLAQAAPESLTHRVVVGDAARTGAIDFEEFFAATPWEERHDLGPVVARRADEVGLLLFTSGTTGEPKCIAHTANTLFASVRTVSDPYQLTRDEVITIPHFLTHMAGGTYSVLMSVYLGATCVMQDDRDMGLLLDMVARHGVTFVYAAPMFVQNMLAAQDKQARDVHTLRTLVSGSAPIPPSLIAATRDVLGVEMYALWGMTENGGVTVTRPDDPPGWAAHSDGRAEPWMQCKIAADPDQALEPGEAPFGRLLVRGASQCLGYLNVPDAYAVCVDADGWFDTGDLARDDGRGGIRITGRRTDLIIRSTALKVPTLEVEGVLLRHPAIADVVLIGYPDPALPSAENVAAVIVPAGDAPTLEQLHAYLEELGMMQHYWPDRVVIATELPKNALGKVQRNILRAELDPAGV
jgi:cyclohexanecarboxylate-CoA ligase